MIDTDSPSVEFNAYDRCDRCGAQAYVSATKEKFELLFCLHHGKVHNLPLELDGWVLAYDVIGIERLMDAEQVTV